MSRLTIVEGNSNNKDNVRAIMVKGEKGEQGDLNNSHIVDNLTTDDNTKVLSAKQGKVLNDMANKKPYYFDTIVEMKLYELKVGDYAITKGYYKANDGGAGQYEIVDDDTLTDDGGSVIELGNGLYATLINDGILFNILQFGVKKDGTEDCSSIVQNVLENIMTENSTLFFPNGVYKFDTAIDMTNCQRRNIKGSFDMNYINSITNKLLFNNCDGFINCSHNEFENLLITGNNETHQNRGFQGLRMKINKCNITFFQYGIYGRGIFINNNISRCTNGITGMVDSRAINNTINACENNCIHLFAGCNDNTITNNRLEWSGGSGVSAYQCYHNIISNNIIDRNDKSGISINDCKRITISGNMMRRNGASAELTGVNSNNMRIESSEHLTITGNMTQIGHKNDDGTGDIVPAYALYIIGSHDFIMSGNDFTGGNSGTIAKYGNNNNITELNLGYNPLENMLLKTVKGFTSTGTLNMDFSVNEPVNNSYPVIAKIGIYYRKTDNSSGGYKEIVVTIYKRYNSTFVVTLSDTTLVDNVITLSGSYADGVLTITATSTSTGYALSANQYYVPA